MNAILSARRLKKTFGANVALRKIDFDVSPGRVTGLVGANGAGKSTLLRILAGAIAPDEGEFYIDGRPAKFSSVVSASRAGIVLVSQELSLFPALSVRENLALLPFGANVKPVAEKEMLDTMHRLGLDISPNTSVATLSLADRQLVEIARALLRKPRALILDEPTSALRTPEKLRLHRIIDDLKMDGVGIVYVSHFLEDLLSVSDDLVILRDGENISPRSSSISDVVDAMLGKRPQQLAAPNPRIALREERKLRITDLKGQIKLSIENWTIPGGSVVGLAGLAGCGIHELFSILFGRLSPSSGTIELPDGSGRPVSISDAVTKRVAFVPSDRKGVGLMLHRSIADNASSVRSIVIGTDGFILNRKSIRAAVQHRCASLGVKMAAVTQHVDELSGGNQQKVVFAKWLEADPLLVLLDDPTRGVDIGAKREMHALIHNLAAEGKVILMYSSDPRELVEACDQIFVFVDGAINRQLRASEFNEHALTTAMNEPRISSLR